MIKLKNAAKLLWLNTIQVFTDYFPNSPQFQWVGFINFFEKANHFQHQEHLMDDFYQFKNWSSSSLCPSRSLVVLPNRNGLNI